MYCCDVSGVYAISMLTYDIYVAVNSLVCHVVSHVLATVSDDPGIIERFMLRVYGLSEYLLKYVTVCCRQPLH